MCIIPPAYRGTTQISSTRMNAGDDADAPRHMLPTTQFLEMETLYVCKPADGTAEYTKAK